MYSAFSSKIPFHLDGKRKKRNESIYGVWKGYESEKEDEINVTLSILYVFLSQ